MDNRRLTLSPTASQPHILSTAEPETFHLRDLFGRHGRDPTDADGLIHQPSNVSVEALALKSWRAPVVMLTSLVTGLLAGLMHHVMNVSLNDTPVNDSGPLSQQWTSRYATSLAFLMKTCLVLCVGTSFIQCQWLATSKKKRPINVRDFDILSSALADFFSLFTSLVWRYPLLMTMVVVSWTIPLAAIIAPGSLTVQFKPITKTTMGIVPQLYSDWGNYTQIGYMRDDKDPGPGPLNIPHFLSNGSGGMEAIFRETPAVSRVAFAAGTGHNILTHKAMFPNSTYSLEFYGPAVKCFEANTTMLQRASSLYGFPKSPGERFDSSNYIIFALSYVSWVPDLTHDAILSGWNLQGHNSRGIMRSGISQPVLDDTGYINGIGDGKGHAIFVLTNIVDEYSWDHLSCYESPNNLGSQRCGVNVTECRLHNATYSVKFTSAKGSQFPTSIVTYHEPFPLLSNPWDAISLGPNSSNNSTLPYEGIMSAFGQLLVGSDNRQPALSFDASRTVSFKKFTHYDLLNIDWSRSEAVATGLEELFRNITLSLFSEDSLTKPSSSPIPIEIISWHNTYVYQPRELLLAYGAAFLASLMCCLIGLRAVFVSKKSYQNIFSTFVRAAEGSDMRLWIPEDDTGADPLPKPIARQIVRMAN